MDKGKHEKNDVYVVTEDYIPKTESVEHKTILRTRVVTMNCYFLHTGSSVSIEDGETVVGERTCHCGDSFLP